MDKNRQYATRDTRRNLEREGRREYPGIRFTKWPANKPLYNRFWCEGYWNNLAKWKK